MESIWELVLAGALAIFVLVVAVVGGWRWYQTVAVAIVVLVVAVVGGWRWYQMPYDAPAHIHEGIPDHTHTHTLDDIRDRQSAR